MYNLDVKMKTEELTIEQLKAKKIKQLTALNKTKWAIKELEEAEIIPALKAKYEGRYFTCKNSYDAERKWDVYIHVLEVNSANTFKGVIIQTDTDCKTTIEVTDDNYFHMLEYFSSKAKFEAQVNIVSELLNTFKLTPTV